jgi:prepilin-type N-terminal cleavage/methylation domain-containing protein
MRRPRPTSGFTLVELLVVLIVVAGALLLVPPNLASFGARSRLENAANTVVSLVAAAREQAIMDGAPVRIELKVRRGEDGETFHSHRLVFTNVPVERTGGREDGDEDRERRREPKEREWLVSAWHDLPSGVEFAGVSERSGQWQPIKLDQISSLSFGPDGSVEKGLAIRVESKDLEENGVKTDLRTLTVLVNALTAEATVVEGVAEMTQQRDENEFTK